ncbi:hypothetical protein D5S17_30920 [Pseudonocardiaceae bacterium YIM PH 21723]|nr:hypothetical protein D5S17_30920 [Pseudonocardiaceae bacterium YIM PH 21723]
MVRYSEYEPQPRYDDGAAEYVTVAELLARHNTAATSRHSAPEPTPTYVAEPPAVQYDEPRRRESQYRTPRYREETPAPDYAEPARPTRGRRRAASRDDGYAYGHTEDHAYEEAAPEPPSQPIRRHRYSEPVRRRPQGHRYREDDQYPEPAPAEPEYRAPRRYLEPEYREPARYAEPEPRYQEYAEPEYRESARYAEPVYREPEPEPEPESALSHYRERYTEQQRPPRERASRFADPDSSSFFDRPEPEPRISETVRRARSRLAEAGTIGVLASPKDVGQWRAWADELANRGRDIPRRTQKEQNQRLAAMIGGVVVLLGVVAGGMSAINDGTPSTPIQNTNDPVSAVNNPQRTITQVPPSILDQTSTAEPVTPRRFSSAPQSVHQAASHQDGCTWEDPSKWETC